MQVVQIAVAAALYLRLCNEIQDFLLHGASEQCSHSRAGHLKGLSPLQSSIDVVTAYELVVMPRVR